MTHEERLALIYKPMPWRVQSFANVIPPAYRWGGVMTGGYLFAEADCGGCRASSKMDRRFIARLNVVENAENRALLLESMDEEISVDVLQAALDHDKEDPIGGDTLE